MLRLILFFFFFVNQFAFAEGTNNIVINGLSKHFDVTESSFPNGVNENNFGLGYEYNFEKSPDQSIEWLLNTGFFKDSLNGTAVYAGGAGLIKVMQLDSVHLKLGIEASGFYSSEYNQGRPFLALMPIMNVGTDKFSLNITVIPKISQFIDAGVIFAQLKIRL
jgi:hypothetical protein